MLTTVNVEPYVKPHILIKVRQVRVNTRKILLRKVTLPHFDIFASFQMFIIENRQWGLPLSVHWHTCQGGSNDHEIMFTDNKQPLNRT